MIAFHPGEVVVVFDGRIAVGACYREGALKENSGGSDHLKTWNITFQSLKKKESVGKSVDKSDLFGPTVFLAFTNLSSIDVVISQLTKLKEKMKENSNEQTSSI